MTENVYVATQELGEQWQQYVAAPSDTRRNELLLHYLPVARFHARRIMEHLPRQCQMEDLLQSAVLGLRSAIDSFDPARGIRFETYCTLRVRGAILDNIKGLLQAPRDLRSRAVALERASQQLRMTLGRTPSDGEIARQLGTAAESRHGSAHHGPAARGLEAELPPRDVACAESSALDTLEDPRTVNPADRAQREELKDLLLRTLTQTERLIMIMYYDEDMTMREIALTLGRTEARVSQIHSRVLDRLRKRFGARFHEAARPRETTSDLD